MLVTVSVDLLADGGNALSFAFTDGSNPPITSVARIAAAGITALIHDNVIPMSFIVLSGNYYKVDSFTSGSSSTALVHWIEWT